MRSWYQGFRALGELIARKSELTQSRQSNDMHPRDSSADTARPAGAGRLLVIFAWAFAQIIAPIIYLELYPFSRSPMFRDAPLVYCEYEVIYEQGRSLPLADFQLSRVYFGNPPGLGVGYQPPATVDRFGEVTPEQDILASVAAGLARRGGPEVVIVTRRVVGAIDDMTVGVLSTHSWRVELDGSNEAQP